MSSVNYTRTSEDVFNILHHAKIEKNKILPTTQVLYFSEVTHGTRLFELNEEIYKELTTKNKVYFRGLPNDKAVLCTDSHTFEVKEAEMSNSMLLVPELQFPSELNHKDEPALIRKEIINTHYTYLEAKLIKPRTRLLRTILERNSYDGKELEPESYSLEDGYCDFEFLLETVQISAEELKVALKNIDAFQLEGFWRVMGFDYHYRAVSFILNIIEEHSWSFLAVPIGKTICLLRELLPPVIADHIFDIYFTPTGDYDDEGMEFFELNQNKVCRLLGEALLRSLGKISVKDFTETWQQSVPEGMSVDLKMLNDLMLIEQLPSSTVISYFPEYKLSEEIQDRFSEIFKVKEKWSFDEIAPFIRKVTSEKQSVKSVLTKYTRASVMNGVTYYGARHGK